MFTLYPVGKQGTSPSGISSDPESSLNQSEKPNRRLKTLNVVQLIIDATNI